MNEKITDNQAVSQLSEILENLNNSGKKTKVSLAEFTAVVQMYGETQKQLEMVSSQLAEVSKRLESLEDKKSPIAQALIEAKNKLQESVVKLKNQLAEVKNEITKNAKKAVTAFKEGGINALNKVLNVIKVKEGLTVVADSLTKAGKQLDKAVSTLSQLNERAAEKAAEKSSILGDIDKNKSEILKNQKPPEVAKTAEVAI
jgi:chromosome segregation ATPase